MGPAHEHSHWVTPSLKVFGVARLAGLNLITAVVHNTSPSLSEYVSNEEASFGISNKIAFHFSLSPCQLSSLHMAAREGNENKVKELVQRGANVNIKDIRSGVRILDCI